MDFLNTLVLVGAIQGVIGGVILYRSKKGNALSNRLLATLILTFSMALLNLLLMQIGFRYVNDITNALAYVLPLLLVMPVGPLLYLYVRSVLEPDFQLTQKHLRHFFLVLFDLFPYAAGVILVAGLWSGLVAGMNEGQWRYVIDSYQEYIDIVRWISVTTYLYFSWKVVRQKKESAANTKWASRFLWVFSAFQLIWLTHLVPYLSPVWQDELMAVVNWYPIYLPLAAIVYWLGFQGYGRTFQDAMLRRVAKSSDATLSVEVATQTYQALLSAMDERKLYLDPELNLERTSQHLGVPQKRISTVLNQHAGKSFNEFVNAYRVSELQQRLIAPGHENFTIMGLAFECGFNSQATMQRSFKQLTHQTPREFQMAHLKKPAETLVKSGFE